MKLQDAVEKLKKEITDSVTSIQDSYPGLRVTSISVTTEHEADSDPTKYKVTAVSITHGGVAPDSEQGDDVKGERVTNQHGRVDVGQKPGTQTK
jgi:hypothetical protein